MPANSFTVKLANMPIRVHCPYGLAIHDFQNYLTHNKQADICVEVRARDVEDLMCEVYGSTQLVEIAKDGAARLTFGAYQFETLAINKKILQSYTHAA